MRSYLDFEKPVAELEAKLDELRALETGDSAAAIREEIIPSGPTASTMSAR
jgi:acetyl-CoA carboxylase carboxyl transferase subunit alpha